MLKVNLEKSLIKQNKKIATPQELLVIQEYDRLSHLEGDDSLRRVGLNTNIRTGYYLKSEIEKSKNETLKFNQDRVFHISQIEKLCNKYRLKFLSPDRYCGTVDPELPNKISSFEIAYGVLCNSTNTKIVAPLRSFKLEERPKDPLFFYKINDQYYYLIHKWGNDLNIFRRLYSLLSSGVFCLFLSLIPICISIFIGNTILCFAVSGVLLGILFQNFFGEKSTFSFLIKNNFNSYYND